MKLVVDRNVRQDPYLRVGFNAFEIDSDDPLADIKVADRDFSVWYQPAGDRRTAVAQLRAGITPSREA